MEVPLGIYPKRSTLKSPKGLPDFRRRSRRRRSRPRLQQGVEPAGRASLPNRRRSSFLRNFAVIFRTFPLFHRRSDLSPEILLSVVRVFEITILDNFTSDSWSSSVQGDISLRTWVGLTLIWDVPPSCPAAQPVLPISHKPRQNQAEGGTAKIKVNPTQVHQEMCYPAQKSNF